MPRTARSLVPFLALVLALGACSSPASSVAPSESASPQPTKSATPEPTVTPSASAEPNSAAPSPSPSEVGELRPFAVASNSEADALFLDRDDCENSADGYRLEFPDAWYTNTAIGDVEPCSWFSPTFYEVPDPSDVPPEIAITIEYIDSAFAVNEDVISSQRGIVGGTQSAWRAEYRHGGEGATPDPSGWQGYLYVVLLGPSQATGPNLVLSTATDMGGDYELNKAVLDRIVATMEFIGTIQ
ncbi:MAG TPA: hypothetical protein VFW95_07400 [Candidatus Limnocylindria bacterium]|nr:hypothetical protein [Candidatus Limnocylindria bacterium]